MYSTLGNLVCIDMCFIKNNNKRNVQDTPIKKKKNKAAGSFMRFTLSKGISKIDYVSKTQNSSVMCPLCLQERLYVLSSRNTFPLPFPPCMVSSTLCRYNYSIYSVHPSGESHVVRT